MKKEIHPVYQECSVNCACGNAFKTRSTQKEIRVGVCSQCHPYYSGKRGSRVMMDGRLEKFQKKYAGINYGQKETTEQQGL